MTSNNDDRQTVLVGVDGSEESVAALRWAADYAKATGAVVRAVMAWHFPAAVGVPVGQAPKEIRQEAEQQQQRALAEAITGVYPDPVAGVQSELCYGHAAQVLIDESKDADLLVVGCRGHGAFAGMLLGSVSIHCVQNAACPVTVVRPG